MGGTAEIYSGTNGMPRWRGAFLTLRGSGERLLHVHDEGVGALVIQAKLELQAGALPASVGLPYIGVLIGRRVVLQSTVAGGIRLLDLATAFRAACHRARPRIAGLEDGETPVPRQAELDGHRRTSLRGVHAREVRDRRKEP